MGRRLAGLFHGRPRLQVGGAAGRPGRLAGRSATSGSLAILLIAAFWSVDPLSGELVRRASASKTSKRSSTNRSTATIVWRTVRIAALVTLTDAILAFPIAFYMAKVASRRRRRSSSSPC